MDPSASSKVTVEYFDPSGLFPLISSGLLSRLPLRNLQWKSPSRPLRSIASLHVDLVPHGQPADALTRAKSHESARSNDDAGTRAPAKERRHQIPGLRQTPYLKIYLLRCDDNDTYKASSRGLLREWIKSHTAPSQSTASLNTQENHDAFEWLIVHVVLPNTYVALQPTTVNAAGASGAVSERLGGGPRWPVKGSSTVLEKIRADFNGSSKSSLDRVAQIRLHKTDIPPHLLPELPANAPSQSNEGQQEQDAAWSDLVMKLKSLILASFTLRVSQYEEDIRQRDAQRTLPGWNFCTFFVLKEGLARGFESVGLVEDALVGYDELAAGLDAVTRDLVANYGGVQGTTFLEYTEDLQRRVDHIISRTGHTEAQADVPVHEENPWNTPDVAGEGTTLLLDEARKPYRELILSNKISLFDFRCYLFARQKSLLLRLANAWLPRGSLILKLKADQRVQTLADGSSERAKPNTAGKIPPLDEVEDLVTLAELCRRAVEFIPAVARVMRADLWNWHRKSRREQHSSDMAAGEAEPAHWQDAEANKQIEHLIDNLVISWTFSMAQQILAELSTATLLITSAADVHPSGSKTLPYGGRGQEPKTVVPEPKTMMHPARASLLQAQSTTPGQAHASRPPPPASQQGTPAQTNEPRKAGSEDLAYHRAELYMLQRNALKHLGRRRRWSPELGVLDKRNLISESQMEEINLQESNAPRKVRVDAYGTEVAGIENELLREAVSSKEEFFRVYELLTNRALSHFELANKRAFVEAATTELAVLRYQLGDFETAATYFGRLSPVYASRGWDLLGSSLLRIYAECLKELNRPEKYIHTLLELLARAAAVERRDILQRRGTDVSGRLDYEGDRDWPPDDEALSTDGYLSQLADYSRELPNDITVGLGKYFSNVQVEPFIRHYPDKDGFQLQLVLRHLFRDPLSIDKVTVRIVAASGEHDHEMTLESDGAVVLKRGVVRVWVGTHATIPGSYIVDQITLRTAKVVFVHDTLSRLAASTPTRSAHSFSAASVAAAKSSMILCYSRRSAPEAKLELPRHIQLDKVRAVDVCLSSGWNDIANGELRIRSATAGLRLQTAEAEVVEGSLNITARSRSRPGVFGFGILLAHSTIKIRIPYALEQDLPEISVKIELDYTTKKGRFYYSTHSSLSILLPLGVNVQDIFKEHVLFSKFTVSTASEIPLRLLSSSMESSDSFEVQSAGFPDSPLLIFPSQPASLIYKIKPAGDQRKNLGKGVADRTSLVLNVECVRLVEEINATVGAALGDALNDSPHQDLSRLLVNSLSRQLQGRSPFEYETIGVLGEINLGSFESMRWDEMLKYLHPSQAKEAREWLIKWHQDHNVMKLPINSSLAERRRITIPVDIPQMQVIHTAELKLLGRDSKPLDERDTIWVGHVMPAELSIRHTRAWSPAQAKAPAASNAPIKFIYEIHAEPDNWLLGGQRKAQFAAKENEVHTFRLTLIPLRAGHLLLPTVEIRAYIPDRPQRQIAGVPTRPISLARGLEHEGAAAPPPPPPKPSEGPGSGSDIPARSSQDQSRQGFEDARQGSMAPISCATDYRNQAQAVLALADVKSTTVGLEVGGPGAAAVLLDTERRSGAVYVGSVGSA